MENDPFIVDFPMKTSIYGGFSMAMLNKQMVITIYMFADAIGISSSGRLDLPRLTGDHPRLRIM